MKASENFETNELLVDRNWGWIVALGALLMVVGAVAFLGAMLTTLMTVLFLGWTLVLGGMLYLVHAIRAGLKGTSGTLLAGILHLVVGILLIRSPVVGAETITLLMAASFIVGGFYRIVIAGSVRFSHWGWSIASGAVSVALGFFVLGSMPAISLWLLGMYVGVDLMMSGGWLVTSGLAVKAYAPEVSALSRAA